MIGFDIKMYFKPDGSFWGSVNGVEFQMDAWIGVQCIYWNENPRDWKRRHMGDFEPNDLARWLKKKNEKQ